MRLTRMTLVAALLLLASGGAAQAGWWGKLFHSMRTDFHRNNEWPYTFVYADREATLAPFDVMAYNGWRVQNTISDHHFDENTGELTEAGRIKVQWIVTQAPEQFRTIYVERAESSEITVGRLEEVRIAAVAVVPEGTLPDIAETNVPARGTPADYIDNVGRKYSDSMPAPRLPKSVSDSSGS